jgi:glc operon protein GlcG
MFARRLLTVLPAAALTLGLGAAQAQVNPKLIISGKAAESMGDANIINGRTAEAISHACEGMAAEHGEAVAVVVLDPFGNIVHEHRMDGAAHYVAIHTAEMKAHTAFLLRQPSSLRQNTVARNPALLPQELAEGFFPVAGGLPIWAGKQIIGFIGVGGQRPTPQWSDEICAWRALEQVVGPQPPLPRPPPERPSR